MGYAIARAAAARGAEVTLVSGPTSLPRPSYMHVVDVVSAKDMFDAVTGAAMEQDIIIKAAAVADFRPASYEQDKIKKEGKDEDLSLPLERTDDILGWLGTHRRPGQILCGFSMETKDMVASSRKKLEKKHLDMIAANNVREPGAGFQTDTNRLTLLTKDGEKVLPLMSKYDAANALLDALLALPERE